MNNNVKMFDLTRTATVRANFKFNRTHCSYNYSAIHNVILKLKLFPNCCFFVICQESY